MSFRALSIGQGTAGCELGPQHVSTVAEDPRPLTQESCQVEWGLWTQGGWLSHCQLSVWLRPLGTLV